MRLYSYIVSASSNPDNVECYVPFRINSELIFFGPCKRALRKELRKEFDLSENGEVELVNDEIYVMGLNGSNNEKNRKIVWLGKIIKLLTFERAYHLYAENEDFKSMVNNPISPLHVKPLYNQNNEFIGYELISKMHEDNNEWIKDIAKTDFKGISSDSKSFKLKDGFSREILEKDCCFICENIFFAEGGGFEIDSELLQLFKTAQPRKNVDKYAIFGRDKNDNANGLRGTCLKIVNPAIITKFVSHISKNSKSLPKSQPYLSNSEKYRSCCCDVIDEKDITNGKC